MLNKKKIVLSASAAAVALGLGLGATGMASATTATAPASSATSTDASVTATGDEANLKGPRGGHGRVDAAELAEKLGVDEAAVTDALATAAKSAKADIETVEGERPDREALKSAIVASLAETLGIEEATVQAAIEELKSERQAERAAAVQERLDAAVADGSLTQAEADGAAKALELGIIGGGVRG